VIVRRLLFVLASVSALSVSAGVFVVALAFALYAAVKPYVGPAGASAIVAGAAAVLAALIGLILGAAAKPPKRKAAEPQKLVERLLDFVKEKPVITIAGAVATGLLAVRNPRYLGAVIRAFVEGRPPAKR
jgi:hypothetical protein